MSRQQRRTSSDTERIVLALTLLGLVVPAFATGWGPLAVVPHLFVIVRRLQGPGGLPAARQALCFSAMANASALCFVLAEGAPFAPRTGAVDAILVIAAWLGMAWTVDALATGDHQRRRNEHALLARADHDQLTGLLNRQAFEVAVADAIADLGERQRVSVLFVDLDGFKAVNDSLGHAAGDQVLRELARRLALVCGDGLHVGRQGGDEFCVLVPRTGLQPNTALASHIVAALEGPLMVGREVVRVGCSVGVASGGRDAEPWSLLQRADAAMYRAKSAGGGQWELADPPQLDLRFPSEDEANPVTDRDTERPKARVVDVTEAASARRRRAARSRSAHPAGRERASG